MSASEQMDFAAMAAPTDDHARFKPFEGTFHAEVQMWMGPGDPMTSTGTMVNTLDLGGRFLHQHYTGHRTDGPFPEFKGRGYWGYNKTLGAYEGFWIDNASTQFQVERGQVDATGKVWTMLSDAVGPRGPMKKRSVITLVDDDHHSIEMYFTEDGQPEGKVMAIQYTRQP